MNHIAGSAPFPWPKPFGGGLSGIDHISPPQILSGSLKAILPECTIFCRLLNVQQIGYLGAFNFCRARDTMLCTTKSQLEIRPEKTLVDVNFFCLPRSQKIWVLRDCTLATLGFRLPYCSGAITSSSSARFIAYLHIYLLCIFISILNRSMERSL